MKMREPSPRYTEYPVYSCLFVQSLGYQTAHESQHLASRGFSNILASRSITIITGIEA